MIEEVEVETGLSTAPTDLLNQEYQKLQEQLEQERRDREKLENELRMLEDTAN